MCWGRVFFTIFRSSRNTSTFCWINTKAASLSWSSSFTQLYLHLLSLLLQANFPRVGFSIYSNDNNFSPVSPISAFNSSTEDKFNVFSFRIADNYILVRGAQEKKGEKKRRKKGEASRNKAREETLEYDFFTYEVIWRKMAFSRPTLMYHFT